MGLAGTDTKRNIEAIALLALFLSFSTFSFINLVTRPIACFPGDIGTPKCPETTVDHPLTWTHFPSDTSLIAPTGLFDNDSSYYFPLDPTNVVSFIICVNIVKIVPNGAGPANDTLTLQYLNQSNQWTNAGPVANGVPIGSSLTPQQSTCNTSPVTFLAGILSVCLPGLNQCEFRIAGNCYEPVVHTQCYFTPGNSGFDTITLSELSVQFYSGSKTIQGTITCTAVTRSLSSFTTNCVRTFLNGAQTITVGWYATNSTGVGAGCGAADNCVRGPATTNCVFAVAAFTCSVAQGYSPAFTGSIPIPTLDWNPIAGITQSINPPFIYNVLS